MSFWDKVSDGFGDIVESIGEGASDWIDLSVDDYFKEANTQPESNDEKAKNVIFGDGKEKPTTTVTGNSSGSLITGVDNKTLALGVVSLIALVLVVKG